jgi:hypothetical protein
MIWSLYPSPNRSPKKPSMTSKTDPRKIDFTINKWKTVSMVFEKGGKLTETDFICCNDERPKNVNSFRYLGVTVQTTSKTVKQHVKERASAALRAMLDRENLRLLSLETAMILFAVKITPILTCGLEQIWDPLTENNLMTCYRNC